MKDFESILIQAAQQSAEHHLNLATAAGERGSREVASTASHLAELDLYNVAALLIPHRKRQLIPPETPINHLSQWLPPKGL